MGVLGNAFIKKKKKLELLANVVKLGKKVRGVR